MSFTIGQEVITLTKLSSWDKTYKKGKRAIITDTFWYEGYEEDGGYLRYEIEITEKNAISYFSVEEYEIADYKSTIPIEKRISSKLKEIYSRQSFKFKEA